MVDKGFWKKKDGTILKIIDMDNDHLINVIWMLKRYNYTSDKEFLIIFTDKFFELQLAAYQRGILPQEALIFTTYMPKEYIPEGLDIGISQGVDEGTNRSYNVNHEAF